ncbi:STAS domain-containing protein [Desulfofustis glycolicus]|uniref:Anti-sigma factor antagonist n=1 Tax=Desulfofustis glycolicus DSM 9705 TaxID=1121409 RepID=A0A1M5TRV7_9BACT|nr:STAS domain-containing protein [Desulfofustis glycolicus]MCB2216557.1 STAS domain-containing protein [Desulfobulbaceae bacterium]SHH53336.1 anti-anti-sigma factor [Desulfofustis glycolicus DSM 9705]
MELTTTTDEDLLIISPQGRLDAVTAPLFDRQVEERLPAQATRVLVNCSGLDYISSAGLRSVLALAKKLQNRGGRVVLSDLHGPVREVFEMAGLYSMLKIYDTEAAARADG